MYKQKYTWNQFDGCLKATRTLKTWNSCMLLAEIYRKWMAVENHINVHMKILEINIYCETTAEKLRSSSSVEKYEKT